MSQQQIEVVCKCPQCERIYRQTVTQAWIGKRLLCRSDQTALRALCWENGQRGDGKPWVGVAYCSECSLRRCPPALLPALKEWLKRGEYL